MALVHKAIDGPRPLNASVLFQHEVPTVGVAAWGLNPRWSPQFVVIDLMGTCAETGPRLRRQMLKHLDVWAADMSKKHWTASDFVHRSRLQWACLDCPPKTCQLDKDLAQYVKKIIKARLFLKLADPQKNLFLHMRKKALMALWPRWPSSHH